MKNLFDFHFHLLFKHLISIKNDTNLDLKSDFKTKGIMNVIDELMGNAFDSQSSPNMVKQSPLGYGVTALMAMEYAFAENINGLFKGFSSANLPINWAYIDEIKNKKTTYFQLFKNEIKYYQSNFSALENDYNIKFLNRKTGHKASMLDQPGYTYLAFSVEGAHNFSDVTIRDVTKATNPSKCYSEVQDNTSNIDLFSINLVHLSEIPEQIMCGFSQALTGTAQKAFRSADFIPKSGFGLSEKAKEFIKTVYLHKYPTLIDVKHMSVYSRTKFYQYREELAESNPQVSRIPIISSHTGFTFCSLKEFLEQKRYRSEIQNEHGKPISLIQAKNKAIGSMDMLKLDKIYSNPWTINLFDEEILEIMESNGMMGISMDQRILGQAKSMLDGVRPEYFKESEAIPYLEWKKWFEHGRLDLEEKFTTQPKTPKQVRHIYLLCAHILYAVRMGYKHLNWVGDRSPWDHICIGSDFDGLINPINPYNDITKMKLLRDDLLAYLPIVDSKIEPLKEVKALQNFDSKPVNEQFLIDCVDKVLYKNGKNMLKRYLNNWQ